AWIFHQKGQPGAARAVGIGHDERADLEGGAVHERHHPRQVQPRPGDGGRAIELEDEGDDQREERLDTEKRSAADEDPDGQGERDAPWWIVELEDGAETAGQASPRQHQSGRPLPAPSRTATMASTQAACMSTRIASRGVAFSSSIADSPSVAEMK